MYIYIFDGVISHQTLYVKVEETDGCSKS